MIGFMMIYWKSMTRKILKWILRSKSSNWLTKWYPNQEIHVNRKIIIRGFQKDQNCRILPCIFRVVVPVSQRPNSDWKWTVVVQTSNWRVKCWWNFMNRDESGYRYPRKADETRNPMNSKSNDLDLRLGRNPFFKINKKIRFLKWS